VSVIEVSHKKAGEFDGQDNVALRQACHAVAPGSSVCPFFASGAKLGPYIIVWRHNRDFLADG
jgi:hypothetical protein